jgi:hypothetical protein
VKSEPKALANHWALPVSAMPRRVPAYGVDSVPDQEVERPGPRRSELRVPVSKPSLRWTPRKLSDTGVVQNVRDAEIRPLMSTTLGMNELSETSRSAGSADRENTAWRYTGASC